MKKENSHFPGTSRRWVVWARQSVAGRRKARVASPGEQTLVKPMGRPSWWSRTRHRRQWKRWQIREAWRGHGQKPRMKTGSTAAVLWLQRPSLAFRQGQRPLTVDMSRLEGHDHTNNTATVHHLVHDGYGVSCSTPRWALAGRVITELALLLICLCYPLIRAAAALHYRHKQPAGITAGTHSDSTHQEKQKEKFLCRHRQPAAAAAQAFCILNTRDRE